MKSVFRVLLTLALLLPAVIIPAQGPSGASIVSTTAGTGTAGFSGDGGIGTAAQVRSPSDVAVDAAGNVFIADSDNFRIRRVSIDGVITTVAGTGTQGYTGDGGPSVSAQLFNPMLVAVDGIGNLYIGESAGRRIRKVSADGIITTIAGNGSSGTAGDGGPAVYAQFVQPQGLAVDDAGNVFIADSNRIRKINAGGVITTVAGTGTSGFSGDGGLAVLAQLRNPTGIFVDWAGNLFVADTGNARVRMITTAGIISTVAGTGAEGFSGDGGLATAAELHGPLDVARDFAGNLFIVDNSNNRIRMVTPGGVINTVAGNGTSSGGDGGPGTSAGMVPSGIALDGSGNISVAEISAHRVRGVTFTQSVGMPTIKGLSTFFGPSGGSFSATLRGVDLSGVTAVSISGMGVSASIGASTSTSLSLTIAVATDAAPGPRTLTVVTPTGTSLPYRAFTVTNATQAPILGVMTPGAGLTGTTVSAFITGAFLSGANSVTFGGTGVTGVIGAGASDTRVPVTVTIAANAAPGIRQLTLSKSNGTVGTLSGFTVLAAGPAGILTTFAGNGTSGFGGDGGLAPSASLSSPRGVVSDNSGNVYIADRQNHRVRRVAPNGAITTIAGTGVAGFGGDGGPATSAQLDSPWDIAIDSDCSLFIADWGNARVRKVTSGGVISTVAGNGMSGFSGDGGLATSAGLTNPLGVAVDASGNLFITGNNRIRKVTSDGMINTFAGTGLPGFSGDGGPASSAQLSSPQGIAVDAAGNLLITDQDNNRIRKVTSAGTISTIAGSDIVPAFSGDGGPATAARLNKPAGVAVDPLGNVYIADVENQRIRAIGSDGIIRTIAGTGVAGFSGDLEIPTSANLNFPMNVATDAYGNLFIVDVANNRVRKATFVPAITGGAPSSGSAGTSFTLTVSGTRLMNAASAVFEGTGVTATIQPGGTATALTLLVTIASGATTGPRTLIITRSDGTSVAFGFNIASVLVPPEYFSFVPPVVRGSYVDPVFGTTFTRVSDAANTISSDSGQPLIYVEGEYSTKSPFNADNSKLLLLEFSYFALYDGTSLQRIRPLCCSGPIVAASSEPLWSRTDPNLFYFHPAGSNQLKTYNVATDVVKLVHTFSEYSSINAQGESEMSYDGDHIVLAGDGHEIFVYTISTDTKGPVLDTTGKNPLGWDAIYVSPDNNVLIAWRTNGSGRFQGEELYDQNMNFLRQVAKDDGHKHLTRDLDGSEVLVQTNSGDSTPIPNCHNGIVKINLATTQQTCLLQLDFSMSVHVTAPDYGGWVFIETNNNNAAASPWYAYTNELLQIKLDGSEVRRLGHHRSDGHTYDGQPRISVSRDGSRFIFNSNMMGATTDVYLASVSAETVPVPMVLTSISPTTAGENPFTLTVTGTNFAPGVVVIWNGTARPTTFINNTMLTASIASLDLAIAGVAQVGAFNPVLGGRLSNVLPFTVTKRRRGQLVSQ